MKIILNERRHAERALQYGEIDRKPTKTLGCLAKYGLEQGKSADNTYDLINNFMTEYYPDYNTVHWDTFLTRLIKQSQKYIKSREEAHKSKLIEIDSVSITYSELRKIKQLKSKRLEKLAFVLLVYSKINNLINENDTYWINNELKEIYSDSQMAVSKKDQGLLVHRLIQLGYLQESRYIDSTNVQVLFAVEEDEVAFNLVRFDDFVFEYLRWKGENIKNCTVCGKRMLARSNRMKYCRECKRAGYTLSNG